MRIPSSTNEHNNSSIARSELVDTPQEERFDRITRIAQHTFNVPMALIMLADGQRHWAKSCLGLNPAEVPPEIAFCTHTINQNALLIVPDATQDERFNTTPLVTGPAHIRFFVGQPLRNSAGAIFGVFCILDREPRTFPDPDQQLFIDLAAWVESEINNDTLNQALESQRYSETYLRTLMDNIGDGLITFDATGIIEALNPAAERMFGYNAPKVVGEPLWLLLPRSYPNEPIAGLLRKPHPFSDERRGGAQSNNGFRRERQAKRGDGSFFPAELTVSAMEIAGKQQYIASVRDITDRRAAAAALHLSETRLQAVVNNLPVIVFSTDAAGIFTLTEGQGLDLIGQEPGQEVGQSSLALFHDFPAALALMQRALAGETCADLVQINGLSLQAQVAPLLDEAGAIIGTIGVVINITARVNAERELRETLTALETQYTNAERSRSEMHAVLDAASEGMALVTPDRRFLTINRRFADFFALRPEEVIGHRFEEFAPLIARVYADPEAFGKLVSGTATDTERQFTAIVAQKWPEVRELQLFTTPVHSERNHFLGRLYVLRDVTQERQLDRMKTEFISRVSHELRTPMTSIKGFVDLLLDGEAGQVTEEQHEFLEIVSTNTDRLLALINDLLDVSRIESGRMKLQRESLDLAQIIRGVASSLVTQIEAKQQTLTVTIPPDLPPIAGDPNRVQQIVANLLTNAHKYTPSNGTIQIEAMAEGTVVKTTVRDSGVGLSPDEQSQIFTKFFRAQNRTTQEAGGTGLGLALTRSLVELQGGEITLSSVQGQGATFTFTLPIDPDRVPEPVTPTPHLWGKQIILVEPDHNIADLIRRYLVRNGYQVTIASDNNAAMHVAEKIPPDLLIVDLDLPDNTDGFAAFAQLRAEPWLSNVPTITLSIHDMQSQARTLGATGALLKPVNERKLLDQVHLTLSEVAPESNIRRVIIADADQDRRTLLAGGLRWGGYEVLEVADSASTVAACQREQPDLLLLASHLSDRSGLATLQALRAVPATKDLVTVVFMTNPEQDEGMRAQIEALGATLETPPIFEAVPSELPETVVTNQYNRRGQDE